MQLIHQSCKPLIQEPGLDGIYKQIETAGRTCYKSLDKITPESAKPFVERMIKSNHTAMLEHGTVYLFMPIIENEKCLNKYRRNAHSIVKCIKECDYAYVTTNYRVIIENGWEEDLQYLWEPTEYHEKRYTLLCTTALHCYKDLTRHRTMSFAIESTRYCNYNKEKFGGELTFIKPLWTPCSYNHDWADCGDGCDQAYPCSETPDAYFTAYLANCEKTYLRLIDLGWQAQQAAEVLPQCVKGDMVITGFASDWQHLLDLRYTGKTGAPHPMVKELATLMKKELEKQGFIYKEF